MSQVEFKIDGVDYRADRLNAFQQLHISRRLAPMLPKLVPVFMKLQEAARGAAPASGENPPVHVDMAALANAAGPFADALSAMPDADAEYVVKTCMSVVRVNRNGAWAAVVVDGVIMFHDMGLDVMLPVVVRVIRENLGNFIQGLLAKAPAAPALNPAQAG